MIKISSMRRRVVHAVAVALLGLPVLVLGAEPPAIDPEATAVLRSMTNHLASLQHFSVRGQITLEMVAVSGQKIQFDTDAEVIVERPNKFRATRKGEIADQIFFYDGNNLTLSSPENHVYAVVPAPKTLDAAMDFARDELDILAPGADLIYSNAFDLLTDGMTDGIVISRKAWVHSLPCTHLAFRKPGVDLQVWVSNGAQPLPLKYVLTTTDMAASPQFMLTLSDWNAAPRIDATTFHFTPPAGAKRIDFVRPAAAPAAPH